MSLRFSEILRRGGRARGLTAGAGRSSRIRPRLDPLEVRTLLSNVPPVWTPTSSDLSDVKSGPLANAGQALINVYLDYQKYVSEGTDATFTSPSEPDVRIQGDTVGVDVNGWGDFTSFVNQVQLSGMDVGATSQSPEIAEGWLPISDLPTLARLPQVVGLEPIYVGGTNSVGSASNQSEKTLFADVASATYGVTGAGVKVGVLSDSVSQYGEGSPPRSSRATCRTTSR